MRRRTRAREIALQFLYALDVRGDEITEELSGFLKEAGASHDTREFAEGLVRGVQRHLADIDKLITQLAENWRLERIATIDRNILRLASFELLFGEDAPPKVVINEAIDLGKRYSTAQSGGFINGILDKMKEHRTTPAPTNDRTSEP